MGGRTVGGHDLLQAVLGHGLKQAREGQRAGLDRDHALGRALQAEERRVVAVVGADVDEDAPNSAPADRVEEVALVVGPER